MLVARQLFFTTVPILGFKAEAVDCKNTCLLVRAVGDRDETRPLWRHCFQNAQSPIFVVDSSDRERIRGGTAELQKILQKDKLQHAVLLLFVNKQALLNAVAIGEMTVNEVFDLCVTEHGMFRRLVLHKELVCLRDLTGLRGASQRLHWT
nr:ADP-ribosylation factor 4-like [Oryctolagus cuniculus]